jgi:hypothetical protein
VLDKHKLNTIKNKSGETFWACTKAWYSAIQSSKASSRVPWDRDGPSGSKDPLNSEKNPAWLAPYSQQPITTAITVEVPGEQGHIQDTVLPSDLQVFFKDKVWRLSVLGAVQVTVWLQRFLLLLQQKQVKTISDSVPSPRSSLPTSLNIDVMGPLSHYRQSTWSKMTRWHDMWHDWSDEWVNESCSPIIIRLLTSWWWFSRTMRWASAPMNAHVFLCSV